MNCADAATDRPATGSANRSGSHRFNVPSDWCSTNQHSLVMHRSPPTSQQEALDARKYTCTPRSSKEDRKARTGRTLFALSNVLATVGCLFRRITISYVLFYVHRSTGDLECRVLRSEAGYLSKLFGAIWCKTCWFRLLNFNIDTRPHALCFYVPNFDERRASGWSSCPRQVECTG